jgi:TrpR-related protein YerC/YecD
MDINWRKKENKQLVEAFLALENKSEAERFLRDLLTPQEIKEFANRLEAAKELASNVQYNSIIEDTGLSSATIARIKKWLRGPLGGYRLVLNRLPSTSPRTSHTHSQNSVGKGLSSYS